jgi:GAF domain-containing protein
MAAHNMPEAFAKAHTSSAADFTSVGGALGGAMSTKRPVQIADLAATKAYKQRHPKLVEAVELGGIRTALAVPMLKDDVPIGVIALIRPEVAPFNDKQIALLASFAAQAVIAIENARLLNELRQRTTDLSQRTTDLTEALAQQTATSEVLQVISSSPGDLQPVFEAMLEKAVRVCDAKFGTLYLAEDEGLRFVAAQQVPEYLEARSKVAFEPAPGGVLDGTMRTKRTVQVADLAATKPYIESHNPTLVQAVELGGIRTVVAVPMLKDDKLIGIVSIVRQEVRPFTDRQIALVTNFAAQAVIAIENARLLSELRERTDQLEAQSQELANLNQQLEHRVTDQVGEIERMSRLRRFLPPQVADLIVATGSEKQLESHRREITALFCDLRGFTGFTESADAEDVMALLRDYHAAIGEIIIKYNGTLERYAGDGVMVIFNDPVPVENPALQAVLMALEVREAIVVGGTTLASASA